MNLIHPFTCNSTCVAKQSLRDLSCFLVHEYRSSFIFCKMVKIVVKIKIKFLFLCSIIKKKLKMQISQYICTCAWYDKSTKTAE